MLSVGCSSGEEAYTLAIVARQVQPDPDWIINVIGRGRQPGDAGQGRGGVVLGVVAAGDPGRRCGSAGSGPAADGYQVVDEARRLVQFRQYNIADPDDALWQPGQYDVIFCRNLLMYLTPTGGGVAGRPG